MGSLGGLIVLIKKLSTVETGVNSDIIFATATFKIQNEKH